MEHIEQLEKTPTPRESLFALSQDIEQITTYFDTFVNLAMEDGDVDLAVLEAESETERGRSAKAELQLFDRDLEGEVVETHDLYTAAREMLEQIAQAIVANLETDDWPNLEATLANIEMELDTWQELVKDSLADEADTFTEANCESLLTAIRNFLQEARTCITSITDGTQPELKL